MLKAIFYKELIKSRWYYLAAGIVMLVFTIYAGIYINRLSDLAGMQRLWEYILLKNDSLITIIKYVPLIAGIGGGVAQFVPEMYRKCLKLTLHLPCNNITLIAMMLLFGTSILIIFSIICCLVLYFSIIKILPYEIVIRIISTAIPWFLAGIAGYLFTAWIVLQPVWKKRIFQSILAVLAIKIYYITDTPGAYIPSFWWLIIATPLICLLTILSLNDFKEGRQD